jgi:hypothetical protein
VRQLVEALFAQYDFLFENEQTFELYKRIKDRTQIFWIEEFSFLGEIPAFQGQSTWVGGISVKSIF